MYYFHSLQTHGLAGCVCLCMCVCLYVYMRVFPLSQLPSLSVYLCIYFCLSIHQFILLPYNHLLITSMIRYSAVNRFWKHLNYLHDSRLICFQPHRVQGSRRDTRVSSGRTRARPKHMIAYTTIDLLRSGRCVAASVTRDDQLPHRDAYGKTSLTLFWKFDSATNSQNDSTKNVRERKKI